MRIDSVELTNFRCFRHAKLDLGADVVAVYGRNGVGKTALFDAIEFALFGRVSRLARFDASLKPLRHVYAGEDEDTGVTVATDSGTWIRTAFSPDLEPSVESSGGWPTHLDILYRLLVDADFFPPRRRAESVEEMFRSTLLLSQDSIRRFVEGDPGERASVLATLAGSAHLLRSSDKAQEVTAEALRRARRSRDLESEASHRQAEADRSLADRRARLVELAATMASDAPISMDHVASCLAQAELSVPTFPTDPEGIELFVTQVLATTDERRRDVHQLNAELARIAEGWDSHLARQRRIDELESQLSQLHDERARLEQSRSEADASIATLTDHVRSLRETCGSLQRFLNSRRDEAALHREDTAAAAAMAESRREIVVLEASIGQHSSETERLRADVASADAAIAGLQDEWSSARARAAAIEELERNCEDLDVRRTRLQEVIRERGVREEEHALQEQMLRELREALTSQDLRLRRIQTSIDEVAGAMEGQKDLIAALRAHVSGDMCPLCGTRHESEAALLAAIDRSLAAAPPALKALSDELAEGRRKAESLRAQYRTAESTVDSMRSQLSVLSEEQSRLAEELGGIETRAAELDLRATNAEIAAGLESARDRNSTCEQRLREATEGKAPLAQALSTAVGQLEQAREALAPIRERLRSLEERRSSLAEELALTRARIEREVTLDPHVADSDAAEALASRQNDLAANEVRRQEAERTLASIRERLSQNRQQRDALEEERAQLSTSEAAYRERCEHVGLEPGADLSDVLALQERSRRRLESLAAADAALKRYRLRARRQVLEKEASELLRARESAREQQAFAQEEIRKLSRAADQATRWSERLRDQVNSAIAKTAGRHQLRIERHFKSLIPSPHQFDRVSLDFMDGELVLGVRFRDRRHDAGEPRLFLSNAQANVLAIAIFLSLGSHRDWSKLETILLDDPVQHLDDLDAVAFLDTLRATALGRFGMKKQIVVSTCDRNLYLMMLKKFRPLEREGLTFRGVSLVNHGLSGPEVIYDHGAPDRAA